MTSKDSNEQTRCASVAENERKCHTVAKTNPLMYKTDQFQKSTGVLNRARKDVLAEVMSFHSRSRSIGKDSAPLTAKSMPAGLKPIKTNDDAESTR